MPEASGIRVSVVYSPAARKVFEYQVSLAPGASVMQALQASGIQDAFPELDLQSAAIGVWGKKSALDQKLREGDRVELYRPLQVDPKVARRERFKEQGSRGTGLFAQKKKGPAGSR